MEVNAGFKACTRCALALLLWCCAASAAWCADLHGMVSLVRDGDTVLVVTDRGNKVEVRLDGIDAPEKARKGRAAQRYADRSTAALRRIAMNQRVSIEGTRTDKYGRRLGVLWVETDGGTLDAGLMQVQLGMARVVPHYLPGLPAELRASYRYAEAIAKSKGRGVWSNQKAVQRPRRNQPAK
jgi:endonuclease YncB( thermonuclease family)